MQLFSQGINKSKVENKRTVDQSMKNSTLSIIMHAESVFSTVINQSLKKRRDEIGKTSARTIRSSPWLL